MKKVSRLLLVIILCPVLILSSCKKEDKSPWERLVSAEKAVSYTGTYINTLVTSAANYYPEVGDLSPLLSGGVDVYRLTYKTAVASKAITASGLMCVPQGQGSYPVICFLNGTNTVNAYAPSNYVINTQYQLVEIIASMGYVVLIPDYPGFGASASIPHPYLVKDPTVKSVIDIFYAAAEAAGSLIKGIEVKNEYYLTGYSQGGWAAMALHYALENQYADDFSLRGSMCGAGPYDIAYIFSEMIGASTYPMPVYLAYIVNAYKAYNQVSNPVTDIFNEPYASRLPSLFNGENDFDYINSQLTTSVTDLVNSSFLTGFASDPKYEQVRNALAANSIPAWHTNIPLYMIHGMSDTQVSPGVTGFFYDQMISHGSSPAIVRKEMLEGLDHGDAAVPAVIKGLLFINDIHSKLN